MNRGKIFLLMGFDMFHQTLRMNRYVVVENQQHVAASHGQREIDGVGLAGDGLMQPDQVRELRSMRLSTEQIGSLVRGTVIDNDHLHGRRFRSNRALETIEQRF